MAMVHDMTGLCPGQHVFLLVDASKHVYTHAAPPTLQDTPNPMDSPRSRIRRRRTPLLCGRRPYLPVIATCR